MALPIASSVALLTPVNNGNGTLTDEFVSGLVQGGSWTFGAAPRVLTWSLNINEETGSYPGPEPVPGAGGEWSANPAMTVAVTRALQLWENVADIDFQRFDSGQYYFESAADLAITLTGDDLDGLFPGAEVAGAASYPDENYVENAIYSAPGIDRTTYPGPEGDVFLDNFDEPYAFLAPGGAGFTVILHELGHALGLKHPFDDGDNLRPTFDELGIETMDRMRYTVMSYDIAQPPYTATGFAATLMPLDILAVQHIYGANMSYRAGNDAYALANGSYRTIWDAGGEDSLSAASWAGQGGVLLDLNAGAFSGRLVGARRLAIAYNVTIEDAVGSSAGDRLVGNGAANELDGGAGADALYGGAGHDRLRGGAGADQLYGGAGHDRLRGGAGGDRLEGGGGNDLLFHTAADFLVAGGAGYDTLNLMAGNLDLRFVSGTQLTGIERINLNGAGASVLTLSMSSLLDLSPTSNTVTVLGDAGDTVRIVGAYTDQGVAGGYHSYRLGVATLLVDTDVTVI